MTLDILWIWLLELINDNCLLIINLTLTKVVIKLWSMGYDIVNDFGYSFSKWVCVYFECLCTCSLINQLTIPPYPWGSLEPIPADSWPEAGCTLVCLLVYLTYRGKQPFMLTFTPTGNLESPVNLTCICAEGGNQRIWRTLIQAQGRTCKHHTEILNLLAVMWQW